MTAVRHRVLYVAVLLLATTANRAESQVELRPGVRVRLEAPGILARRYVGTVIAATPDTLVVANTAGAQYRLPMRAVSSLEVSRGESRASGAGRGALWGAGTVGGAGLLIALSATEQREDGSFGRLDGDDQLSVVAYSALSGAFYGAIIGAIVGREQWARFEPTTQVSVVPTAGGAAVALSWRR